MDIRGVFPFISGILCGAGGTAVILDRYYCEKYEERMKLVEANLLDYYKNERVREKLEEKKKEYFATGEGTNTGRDKGILPKEERIRIKDDWSIDKSEFFDYTKFYTQKQTDSLIIAEPEKSIDTVSDESQAEINEYSKEIRRSSMPPRILSDREAAMIPDDEYTTVKLYYYMYDDTVVAEGEDLEAPWRVIEEPEKLIGECLTKHGFDSNSDEMLYVINNQLKEVYHIKKKWANYRS